MSEECRRGQQVLSVFRRAMPIFHALGDKARQDIVLSLGRRKRMNVGQIAAESPLSRPAISHHLKVLRDAGICELEPEGTENYYSLNGEFLLTELKALVAAIEEACPQ